MIALSCPEQSVLYGINERAVCTMELKTRSAYDWTKNAQCVRWD